MDRLGQESAMAAAVNLQRDAGFMMTNLQILGQFVINNVTYIEEICDVKLSMCEIVFRRINQYIYINRTGLFA